MTKSIANFKGAVLGAAIGDALGFIIEKKPITEVERFVTTFKKMELTLFLIEFTETKATPLVKLVMILNFLATSF